MKLVLYSGGQNPENHALHRSVVSLCGKKRDLRLTYIPFCSDNAKLFYSRTIRRFKSHGVSDFHTLTVDQPFTARDLSKALKSDVIYLAGGNTFYFLKHLKQANLLPKLRRFVHEGGVLAGLSAGALIMTPNIRLAGVPEFDADENEVKLKDLTGLGLTPFEFSPHYSGSKAQDRSLLAYSRKTQNLIYACPNGGGLIIQDDQFTGRGDIQVFHRGAKFALKF